jgi:hypothetical protein
VSQMSIVTNLIINIPSIENERIIRRINQFIDIHYPDRRPFVDIDDASVIKGTFIRPWYAGDKFFEANVYIGAFNHFDLDEFLEFIKSMVTEKNVIQVLVRLQDDDIFESIVFQGRKLYRVMEYDND